MVDLGVREAEITQCVIYDQRVIYLDSEKEMTQSAAPNLNV